MYDLSRRSLLAVGAAGGATLAASTASAASFGNPDQPAEGAINAGAGTLSDPGPKNPILDGQFPDVQSPPPTDVGGMPQFWSSFNIAPKRIQNGGWARQVTQADFAISDTIAGVNMRLSTGGIREMHWHLAAEWAIMTNGRCRITVLDPKGHASVEDVGVGDLWYFPAGYPHSLQGLGPDGCEFILAFDQGHQSEYSTLPLTDWLSHTPPAILAANFGVAESAFKSIPLQNLWIFQGKEPGSLEADQAAVASGGAPAEPFVFRLSEAPFARNTSSGWVRLADSTSFKASKTVASALETLKPGAVREMHWHPNADEWQYWIKGEGRMTVFDAGPHVQTANFKGGDIGYVKKNQGHFVENTGSEDLQFVAVFRTDEYQEISLSDWLTHTPVALVSQHLNIDPKIVARFPMDQPGIVSK
jgi:oxalate decarboxylase